MTSYEFEVAAKNAVIKVWHDAYDEVLKIEDINLVWFTHVLGFKKCFVYGLPMGNVYAEVTYNRDKNEMYVDLYMKISNTVISSENIDIHVKEAKHE